MRKSLKVSALVFAAVMSATAGAAFASLESDTDTLALPKPDVAMNEYTGVASTAHNQCKPRYLPSFIRTKDGTIIGVGYLLAGEIC